MWDSPSRLTCGLYVRGLFQKFPASYIKKHNTTTVTSLFFHIISSNFSPGDFVLDGDTAPSPKRGSPPQILVPYLLWPNGWMDQDGAWHGGGRPNGPKVGQRPQFSAHICCGQTAGCIKMPLGKEVGLSQGHFVLDGDPASLPKKGRSPPIFGPRLLWSNGCMVQDATWYGGRPQPKRLCVRWGPSPLPQKTAESPAPIFCPCLLWPNGWMDQDGDWQGGVPWSRPYCARWSPSSPPQKGTEAPDFWPIFMVAKRLDASRCHLVWR